MPKQKQREARVRVGKLKLQSSARLNKTEQKKVKGGTLADGSVRALGVGSVRFIEDGTSNT